MPLFYISFVEDEKFQGATVVEAPNENSVLSIATTLGLNPGGEALILEVPKDLNNSKEIIKLINRLALKEELANDEDFKEVKYISPEEYNALENNAKIVRQKDK